MRDRVSRHVPIAGENLDITGHPAKEKFGEFASRLEATDNVEPEFGAGSVDACEVPNSSTKTKAEREIIKDKKIQQIDEVIKEDIERTKG